VLSAARAHRRPDRWSRAARAWPLAAAMTLVPGLCVGSAAGAATVAPGVDASASASLLTPPASSGRTHVAIAMRVINVSDVDEVLQRFRIVGYLTARWQDPRLAFVPARADERYRVVPTDQLWRPHFDFVNGVVPHAAVDVAVRVAPDGTVDYSERSSAELSNPFHLRAFPFDRQELEVLIHVPAAEEDVVELSAIDAHDALTAEPRVYSSLAQWDLTSLATSVLKIPGPGGGSANEVRFAIAITRRHQFYVWKVFLPLLLMVVLSWTVLWIDPSELSGQTTISVTTILTMIAFSYAIAASLPKVPYLTLIDVFFLTCYSFAFLTAIEVTAVHWTARSGRAALSQRIQRTSRVALPVGFVVASLGSMLLYGG
jgi:hypothetical protein